MSTEISIKVLGIATKHENSYYQTAYGLEETKYHRNKSRKNLIRSSGYFNGARSQKLDVHVYKPPSPASKHANNVSESSITSLF